MFNSNFAAKFQPAIDNMELMWSSMPHQLCHFRGGLHSQSIDWYWQTKQYRKIHKL